MEVLLDLFFKLLEFGLFAWSVLRIFDINERLKNMEKYLQLTGMPTDEKVLSKMWDNQFQPQAD